MQSSKREALRWPLLFLLAILVSSSPHAAPANDNFASPYLLTEFQTSIFADLEGATLESGEPNHYPFGKPDRSVWWQWTAQERGSVLFRMIDAVGVSAGFQLYTGSSLQSLTPLNAFGWNSVQPGETYHLAVWGRLMPSTEAPWLEFQMEFQGLPQNDHFADREQLSGLTVEAHGTTLGASSEPGEPPPPFVDSTGSVWFSWTAPFSSAATLLPPSSMHLVTIYKGSALDQLERVEYYHESFEAHAGVEYYIRISGHPNAGNTFSFKIMTSPLRVISPPDGTEVTDVSNLHFEFTGVPEGTLNQVLHTKDDQFIREVPLGQTRRSLADLPPGEHQLRIGVHVPGGLYRSHFVRVNYRPNNDHLSSAREILGTNQTVTADFRGSTTDPSEPPLAGTASGTLWWKWTAPFTGRLFLVRLGDFTRELFFASGTNLSKVSPGADPWYLNFPVTNGTTYFIRAFHHFSPLAVESFDFAAAPTPGNDAFATPLSLFGTNTHFSASMVGSTFEPGEPGLATDRTLWFQFIAPTRGRLTLTASAQNAIAQLSLYKGASLSTLTTIKPRDAQVETILAAGDVIRIQISTPENPFALVQAHLQFIPPPANDSFADRITLQGLRGTVAANFDQAALEPFEPFESGSPHTRTIWFQWSVPGDGVATVSTPSGQVELYSGTTLSSLRVVAGREYNGVPRRIAEPQTYVIRLAGSTNDFGEYSLTYRFDPRPPNDNLGHALQLPSSTDLQWSGFATAATRESSEPLPTGMPTDFNEFASVWWKWTAPESGMTRFTLSEAAMHDVFTGSSFSSLTRRSTWDLTEQPWAAAVFNAVAGQTYYLRVATVGPGFLYESNFRLVQPNRTRITSADRNVAFISISGISEPGSSVVLYSSTNLTTWRPRSTNLLGATNLFRFAPRITFGQDTEFFSAHRQ